MTVWDEISAIVRRNLDVFYKIEAIDVSFRFKLDANQRAAKAPWIMMGRDELVEEELAVWQRLDGGQLSDEQAIAQMRNLMAQYYEKD